jgi:hypothetical protein
MSRGLHGGVANADWDGAIARYFSKQVPGNPGIIANNETFPRQSTVSIFCVHHSLTIRSVLEAATPMGMLTVAKGVGLAKTVGVGVGLSAGCAGAIARSLTGARIVAKGCGLAA